MGQSTVTRSNLHWLPNALTASRLMLTVPVYLMAVQGRWALGCLFIAAALITDFFDGLAAKKLHAETVIGGYIDSIADFMLAAAGIFGLIVGAGMLPVWTLYVALPISLFVGYAKFFSVKGGKLRTMITIFSLPLLFSSWIGISWGYLTQAFGWSWVYLPITSALLLGAARLKRHRLKAWFGWLFSRPRT